MPQVFAVVGAIASVVGTARSARAQRRSLELQREQQEVSVRRSRRQSIRQMQFNRARATASAVGAGSFGGSGFLGGVGSLSSQLGEQFGFSTQMSGLSRQITSAQASAVRGQEIAGIGGDLFTYGYNNSPADSFVRNPFGTRDNPTS